MKIDHGLYVVATPIGNMGDMVHRAVHVLQTVALIAAEDTRHSQRLFQHYDIHTAAIPYHEHSEEHTAQKVIAALDAGDSVALISDAGTPLISDPGYRLVNQVRAAGHRVLPVPGANAAIAALSVAGLPTDSFLFIGFLPVKSAARSDKLRALRELPHTLVCYEAPHRVIACLEDMRRELGPDRPAVLARELTKMHETVYCGDLAQLCDFVSSDANQQRGEIVILVQGEREQKDVTDVEASRVLDILLQDLPLKQAAALAAQITGAKKNQLYQQALNKKR
ncbi:MAG: 16S rRNA (cytidine(1402)-2'-O)-methyltransferase [Pseudomonadales bacterium]